MYSASLANICIERQTFLSSSRMGGGSIGKLGSNASFWHTTTSTTSEPLKHPLLHSLVNLGRSKLPEFLLR